jgi:hypothetical protein
MVPMVLQPVHGRLARKHGQPEVLHRELELQLQHCELGVPELVEVELVALELVVDWELLCCC